MATLLTLRVGEQLAGEGVRVEVDQWVWPVVSPEHLDFEDPWTARILDALRRERRR